MQDYEILYLVSGNYTEDEIGPLVDKINEVIKAGGGEITHQENWGKLKLAYPIKHENYGYYFLTVFNSEKEAIKKIDEKLRLTLEVLRFQIVKHLKKTAPIVKKEEKKEKTKRSTKKVSLEELDKKLDEILEGEKV